MWCSVNTGTPTHVHVNLCCCRQQALARPRSLDIAISNDDASTIIHVRGTGSSSRMTDMGSVLDRLGALA